RDRDRERPAQASEDRLMGQRTDDGQRQEELVPPHAAVRRAHVGPHSKKQARAYGQHPIPIPAGYLRGAHDDAGRERNVITEHPEEGREARNHEGGDDPDGYRDRQDDDERIAQRILDAILKVLLLAQVVAEAHECGLERSRRLADRDDVEIDLREELRVPAEACRQVAAGLEAAQHVLERTPQHDIESGARQPSQSAQQRDADLTMVYIWRVKSTRSAVLGLPNPSRRASCCSGAAEVAASLLAAML